MYAVDDGNTEVFYFKNGVATMGNIQKNFGSIAGRKVKAGLRMEQEILA